MKSLPGMREFYPEDMRLLKYIFETWRKAAEKYGYEEIEGPVLEPAELWEKKGELTEQMYSFEDKGGRKNAIRPEFTPSLARMAAARQKTLAKPIRWYSINRCWRYERPQKGRSREFFQLNVDCLGTDSMKSDAETIAVAAEILKQLKLTPKETYIRISNRKLLKGLLEEIGASQETAKIIDKKDKLEEKEFEAMLKESGLNPEQVFGLKDILSIGSIEELEKQKLNKEAKQGLAELKELFSYLEMYGIKEYCELDLSIVRGLTYYTSTVFEIFDRNKKFRAIAGGGRYDNLVSDFSKEKCPGIGFGMGEAVLQLFLAEKKKIPQLEKNVEYYVAPLNEKVFSKAIEIAQKLREKANVETDLNCRPLKKQLNYASSIGANNLVIVGEKDLREGKVTIKDLKTGKEEKKFL